MKTATLPVTRRLPQISCRTRPGIPTAANRKIKNVLVPIDFSERSLEALETALSLTKQTGAQLHLVHVYEPDYPLTTVMAMPIVLPPVQVAQGVRRHLKDVAKKHGVDLRPGNTHAVEGKPLEEICRIAREQKIDLIVAAMRGNTGVKHCCSAAPPSASSAIRPVRSSWFTQKPGALNRRSQNLTFGKILVPIDFSKCSLEGLEYAKALAKQFGSKLVLLNAVAFPYYITSDEYARYDLPLLMQQAEQSSRRQMRDLIEKTDWEGIEVKSSLQIGHAGQQI